MHAGKPKMMRIIRHPKMAAAAMELSIGGPKWEEILDIGEVYCTEFTSLQRQRSVPQKTTRIKNSNKAFIVNFLSKTAIVK